MLELKNVCFGVEADGNEKEIIRNVSFDIPDNEFVVITGPNGGGKSTVAKLIAGIEKPTSGKIIFNGEDITERSVTERAKKGIAYAFQNPVKFKGLCVFDLLKIAAGKEIKISDACDYLSAVGLCARDYINREINSSLSGGELKRIEIATVLARACFLSVFDEPEAGIDLWSFQNLIEAFRTMREKIENSSILIISHQERILEIADEIIVIKDGEIEKKGKRDDVLPSLIGTPEVLGTCRNNVPLKGEPAVC